MFENSKDLLYVILSISILWLTIFLCWLLYQGIRVIKNFNKIIESVALKLEMAMEVLGFIKHKVDSLSSSMGAVSGAIGKLVEKFVINKLSDKLDERIEKKKKKL